MRAFWITILLLACSGGVALLLSSPAKPPDVDLAPASTEGEPTLHREPAAPPSVEPLAQPKPAVNSQSVAIGLDQKINEATVRPGVISREADALVADGTFRIPGAGTKESPYEITWELLVSASDTFIPRLGERVIPQRIALLNGAFVRISGFIAFPLVTTESDECLVMLNQWDGCCIGVPPSPYDAIEVKLAVPADNSKRHVVRIGTVEGVLHVDPYLVDRWLVGLYTMDHATLSTEM